MSESPDYGKLQVEVRTPKGKGAARQLRMAGKIPAVVYGRGQDNVSLVLDPLALHKATDPTRSYNTFFELAVSQDGKQIGVESCMVADVQVDPLRHNLQHIDFMRIDPSQDVVRNVPIRTIGKAAGMVKGGRIKVFHRVVRVAAKPTQIPPEIVLDVTPLDMGMSIRMRDVVLPNARIDEPPDGMLAICELAKIKAEEPTPGAPAEAAAGAKPAAGAPAAAAAAPAKAEKKSDKK
jgi:large subunit ribosomal protein L25